jgi:hypothetical protein
MKRLVAQKIDFDDDIVIVYDDKGNEVYNGMFDYCPYKEDIDEAPYNRKDDCYYISHGYKVVCV